MRRVAPLPIRSGEVRDPYGGTFAGGCGPLKRYVPYPVTLPDIFYDPTPLIRTPPPYIIFHVALDGLDDAPQS